MDAGGVGDLAHDLLGIEVNDDNAVAPGHVEPPVDGVHFEEAHSALTADCDRVGFFVAGRGVLLLGRLPWPSIKTGISTEAKPVIVVNPFVFGSESLDGSTWLSRSSPGAATGSPVRQVTS